MVVIIGFVVVLGGVLGGFTMAGGHVGALIHPSEFVTIGGAAFGAMVVMSPVKVLKDLARGVLNCLKGTPYNRQGYEELFKVWYQLMRVARTNGLMSLETHVTAPHESPVFEKYPRIANNHHVMEFICGAVSPIIEGTIKAENLPGLLHREIESIAEDHHAPMGVLAKTADGLPGFGIVAAVLGIVITMGAIDGPVEEIGEKVGAALVGTFLGILMSYGFLGPLVVRMEFLGDAELAYFRTIATIAQGLAEGGPPKVVLESARRGVKAEFRMTRPELDQLFSEVDAS
jgi:chemotaxis protein MotA